jgi:hypothetical protein
MTRKFPNIVRAMLILTFGFSICLAAEKPASPTEESLLDETRRIPHEDIREPEQPRSAPCVCEAKTVSLTKRGIEIAILFQRDLVAPKIENDVELPNQFHPDFVGTAFKNRDIP